MSSHQVRTSESDAEMVIDPNITPHQSQQIQDYKGPLDP